MPCAAGLPAVLAALAAASHARAEPMPRRTPASPAERAQPPRASLRTNRRPRVAALPRQSCASRSSSQGGQPVSSKSNSSVPIVGRSCRAAGWPSEAVSRLRVAFPCDSPPQARKLHRIALPVAWPRWERAARTDAAITSGSLPGGLGFDRMARRPGRALPLRGAQGGAVCSPPREFAVSRPLLRPEEGHLRAAASAPPAVVRKACPLPLPPAQPPQHHRVLWEVPGGFAFPIRQMQSDYGSEFSWPSG